MALPGVLLLAAFLVGVSGWLVGHARSDAMMRAANEEGVVAVKLAESVLQSVAMALGHQPDWVLLDALTVALPCPPPDSPVVPVDEPAERSWLQASMDASSRWGPDTPSWQPLWACHAAAVLGRWPVRGPSPAVLVWVADDPEGDGQPLRSGNQRLMLTAVAYTAGDARGGASATVWRTGPGEPLLLAAWRPGAGY